jgi:hypothetical protein
LTANTKRKKKILCLQAIAVKNFGDIFSSTIAFHKVIKMTTCVLPQKDLKRKKVRERGGYLNGRYCFGNYSADVAYEAQERKREREREREKEMRFNHRNLKH